MCAAAHRSGYRRAVSDTWTPVLPLEDLAENRARKVPLGGAMVMLYRTGDRIFAIGNRCTHQGAPLDRGVVRVGGSEATVTCPAHGSVFRLPDGSVARSPATEPVPAYDVRVTDGTIELKPRS
jgi:nitrite reductase/ring-hydroxylating ferredoxin subunit